jgi:hypothetical protein
MQAKVSLSSSMNDSVGKKMTRQVNSLVKYLSHSLLGVTTMFGYAKYVNKAYPAK